jgi:membrane protein
MAYLKVLTCAFTRWFADNAATTAAALAFYCAFSLAPLLVIILTLSGWIVGAQAAEMFVEDQLTMLFGIQTAEVLLEAVRSSQQPEGYLAAVVSIGTLLLAATTVLAALEEVLNRIWGVDVSARRGIPAWLRRRVLSLGFILALSFLLLVTLTISTMVAGLRSWLSTRYAPLLGAVGTLDVLVSMAVPTTLFALIYRYMPGRRLDWKVVLAGGLVTALLFALGKWLVGLYLASSTVPTAFGAAASFAALLLWLYYTAQIFLFGAEFTACLGGLGRQAPRKPGPGRKSNR